MLEIPALRSALLLLACCGSSSCRTYPGEGHGNEYDPGVEWDVRDGPWRVLTILDLPLSLVMDSLLLPEDASRGPYE